MIGVRARMYARFRLGLGSGFGVGANLRMAGVRFSARIGPTKFRAKLGIRARLRCECFEAA